MMNKKIAVCADSDIGIALHLASLVREKGYEPVLYGSLDKNNNSDWAPSSAKAAQDVASQKVFQGIICCFTGTGASIAANKIKGVRAALCHDAFTAEAARKWNDANVICVSLRLTSIEVMKEMLEAWFKTTKIDSEEMKNIEFINTLQQ